MQKLVSLQQNPANVRNVCILAHVDHGVNVISHDILLLDVTFHF